MTSRSLVLALCLGLTLSPSGVLAQQAQEGGQSYTYQNPTLPTTAPASAMETRQEASRKFMQGMCKTAEAMRSSDQAADRAIKDAASSFSQASDLFASAAESLLREGNADLTYPEQVREGVQVEADNIKAPGFDSPANFAKAMDLLAKFSATAAKRLSEVSYGSTPSFDVLNQLLFVSREAAQGFVSISNLTSLAGSRS